MSTQRGNVKKKRPQKHKNTTAFKNDLHDTSKHAKQLNDMCIAGVCSRCKEIIEWKIKYKKYKQLTQPKKCTKCQQKTVKHAYHIVCMKCQEADGICAKCGKTSDDIESPAQTEAERAAQDNELKLELMSLSERQRRTFCRAQEKGMLSGDMTSSSAKDIGDDDDGDSVDESDDEDGLSDGQAETSDIATTKCLSSWGEKR